jgi:hypothetical protein
MHVTEPVEDVSRVVPAGQTGMPATRGARVGADAQAATTSERRGHLVKHRLQTQAHVDHMLGIAADCD